MLVLSWWAPFPLYLNKMRNTFHMLDEMHLRNIMNSFTLALSTAHDSSNNPVQVLSVAELGQRGAVWLQEIVQI